MAGSTASASGTVPSNNRVWKIVKNESPNTFWETVLQLAYKSNFCLLAEPPSNCNRNRIIRVRQHCIDVFEKAVPMTCRWGLKSDAHALASFFFFRSVVRKTLVAHLPEAHRLLSNLYHLVVDLSVSWT
jgi:hypothetical protein